MVIEMEYFLNSSVLENTASFSLFLIFECKYSSAMKPLILSVFS